MLARATSKRGGEMTLLMARVDPDTIRLIGRWRSDTIIRYIHTNSKTFTYGLAIRIFRYDNYVLIPPVYAIG